MKVISKPTLRHRVLFYHQKSAGQGVRLTRRLVGSRNPIHLKVPKTAFGFHFYDEVEVGVEMGKEMGRKIVWLTTNKEISPSKFYVVRGEVMTVARARREFRDEKHSFEWLRGISSRRKVVHCRTGRWLMFLPNMIILDGGHGF